MFLGNSILVSVGLNKKEITNMPKRHRKIWTKKDLDLLYTTLSTKGIEINLGTTKRKDLIGILDEAKESKGTIRR